MLANKFDEKLGFFIIKIDEKNPLSSHFLIKLKNKLDIGDTNMFILFNKEKGYKELICSFKTIYLNTFNVVLLDVTINDEHLMMFRHESF